MVWSEETERYRASTALSKVIGGQSAAIDVDVEHLSGPALKGDPRPLLFPCDPEHDGRLKGKKPESQEELVGVIEGRLDGAPGDAQDGGSTKQYRVLFELDSSVVGPYQLVLNWPSPEPKVDGQFVVVVDVDDPDAVIHVSPPEA